MLILNCVRCGLPMPPIDEETEEGREVKRLLMTTGFTPQHDVCPAERIVVAAEQAKLRHFEARVQIVELVAGEHDWTMPHDVNDLTNPQCPPTCPGLEQSVEELASFVVHQGGDRLADVMRGLALELGGQWMKVEEHANIIDPPR